MRTDVPWYRYHQTVGRNCVIELAWSVNRSGLVHPADAQRYAEFGEWIRNQYGLPPHFNERYLPRAPVHAVTPRLLHKDGLALVLSTHVHYACGAGGCCRHVGAIYNQTILGNATYDRPTSQVVAAMSASPQTRIDRAMIVSAF